MPEVISQSILVSADRVLDSILLVLGDLQRACEAHPMIALAVVATGCVFMVGREGRSALD